MDTSTKNTKLQFEDNCVLTKGYGLIASSVMENEDVSMGAKCLYAFIISVTGSSIRCYHSNARIMKSLGIKNKSTLNKYKHELIAHGLLEIEKRKFKSGRTATNNYFPAKLSLKNDVHRL